MIRVQISSQKTLERKTQLVTQQLHTKIILKRNFNRTWYRGADKFLARPGRIKLQRPNSNFCKTLKNNLECCPSNQVSATVTTNASDEKWWPFNCFFSRVGLRTYQHSCIADGLNLCVSGLQNAAAILNAIFNIKVTEFLHEVNYYQHIREDNVP